MPEKLKNYLSRGGALNIVLFKILGIGGVGISFISCISNLLTKDVLSALICGSAGFLAIALLCYVEQTGNYLAGYFIVEFAVFVLLFSVLFFTGSGMDGSMPYFFSFALMFTFLMFEGKLQIVMECFLAVFYLVLCFLSLRFPQLVRESAGSLPLKVDRIQGIFLPAVCMNLVFLVYIREYKKQKKIADDANRAKSVFLANMSHEIRTPIHAVLGFNEMILRTSEDASAKEYAGFIDRSGRRLLKVVNEILDFSRIESGKGELVPENFSLRGLAEEMRSLMSVMAKQRELEYRVDCGGELYDMVFGDREKLVRILTNLLSNAFKYTKKGSVCLSMQLCADTENGQKIRFAVEDTGIGIRMSEVNNLFHAYERADLLKNRNIEGTGLGLPITEQLLHLFGSSVHVESTYGKGSTFSFEITLPAAENARAEENDGEQSLSFSAPDADILVVDDDEMNRRLMDSFLSTLGISADLAESGEECLKRITKADYHLILMDYMMPGMDGAAAMEQIRTAEAETGKHTPIVVLTADAVEGIAGRLKDRGFDDYLSKPVDLRALETILLRFIPEELVLREGGGGQNTLTPQELEAWEELLKGKGIRPGEGLKLVNGDSAQYLRIAEFFADSAPADMRRLQDAADGEDLTELRLVFHSLKGKAGSVGAEELRNAAEEMESKCRAGDLEYVLSGLDLVLLRWKRCTEGLKLLEEAEAGSAAGGPDGTGGAYDGYSSEDLKEELRKNLGLFEGKKAKAAAERMRRDAADSTGARALDEIVRLIDEMEFEAAAEKAEQLFAAESAEL